VLIHGRGSIEIRDLLVFAISQRKSLIYIGLADQHGTKYTSGKAASLHLINILNSIYTFDGK